MSKFVVTVTELIVDQVGNPTASQEVFKQTIETVDLNKLFAAVNSRPRKPRVAKAKTG